MYWNVCIKQGGTMQLDKETINNINTAIMIIKEELSDIELNLFENQNKMKRVEILKSKLNSLYETINYSTT